MTPIVSTFAKDICRLFEYFSTHYGFDCVVKFLFFGSHDFWTFKLKFFDVYLFGVRVWKNQDVVRALDASVHF